MQSRSARGGRWISRLALATVTALGACDSPVPSETHPEASDERPVLAAAIVSNPVTNATSTSVAAGIALSLTATGDLVYVSLPPGTIPDAVQATIRNPRNGGALTVTMLDGGFDPVAVDANAGDTLELDVRITGADQPLLYAMVVPIRVPPVIVRTDPPPKKRDVPLNATMLIVFSEPIDPATLIGSSVQLSLSGAPVAGTLTFGDAANLTVTFTPAEPLVAGADYTLFVTTEISDLDGDALEVPVTVGFRSETPSASLAALIVSNPAASLGGVVYVSLPPGSIPDGNRIVITSQGSVLSTTALVDGGLDPVPVSAAAAGDTLGVRIVLAGDGAVRDFFAVVPPRRPPVVVRTDPPSGRQDVLQDVALRVVFSEPIAAATLTPSSVQPLLNGAPVAGALAFGDGAHLTVTFTPAELLVAGTDYTLLVTQAIEDLDGDALAVPLTVGFATGELLPPGTQLAFVRDGQIYQVNSDGTGLVRLSEGPGDGYPAWSPDGSRIAFSSARGAPAESTAIYIMDADGSNLVRRMSTPWSGAPMPSWSPDGAWIVFAGHNPLGSSTSGAGSLDLYTVKADDDGSAPIDITDRQGFEWGPAWSPDGTRIAFLSDWVAFDFTSDVFLTTPTGSQPIQLTNGFGWAGSLIEYYQPAWSPDGQRLALVTCLQAVQTCGASTVSVMNADGTGLTQLAATIGFARPTWSPDGRTIAFGSSGSIYWISADGSTRGLIIPDGHDPAWRP